MAYTTQVKKCAECESFIPTKNLASHVCSNQNKLPLQAVQSKPSQQSFQLNHQRDQINTEAIELEIIHCVEIRRPLWDHKSLKPVERSEAVRNKLWKEICEELQNKYDIDTLKNNWKYMRDEFTRRRKGVKSGSAATKEWFYMRHLAFLDDMISYEPTISNLVPETLNNKSTNEIENDSGGRGNGRKKRKLDDTDSMQILIDELKTTRPKTPPPDMTTADDKFGIYLISIMADFSKEKKRKLQGEFIARVLSEIDS